MGSTKRSLAPCLLYQNRELDLAQHQWLFLITRHQVSNYVSIEDLDFQSNTLYKSQKTYKEKYNLTTGYEYSLLIKLNSRLVTL